MKPRIWSLPAVAVLLLSFVGGCENTASNSNATPWRSVQVFELNELNIVPQVIYRAAPVYPPGARRRPIAGGGDVLVDFVVDEQGFPQEIRVVKASSPEFGDAAATAIAQWKFYPGQKDGRPVRTHMQVPLVFSNNES